MQYIYTAAVSPALLMFIVVRIRSLEDIHRDRIHQEQAHIEAARAAYPSVKTFQSWVEQKKGKISERDENWNQVSILRLFTGKL